MKNQFKFFCTTFIVILFIAINFYTSQAEARRGCCSWHGGVCGCRCCDGSSLSAKCAPYYPSCSPIKPIVTPELTLPQKDIPIKEFKQEEDEIEKKELNSWLPKNEPSVLGKSQTAEIQKNNVAEEISLEDTNDFSIGTLIFLIMAGGFGYWFLKK
ncbi:MAG: hypothetical protein KAQ87_04915 [Candidatus Pacebacteria bacterium]|nr:hypothetical protein [Candidatus Paceibacterota bacterium]